MSHQLHGIETTSWPQRIVPGKSAAGGRALTYQWFGDIQSNRNIWWNIVWQNTLAKSMITQFYASWFSDAVYRHNSATQIAKFMGPTWGPPGSCRTQMGPTLAPWTLLSGKAITNQCWFFMWHQQRHTWNIDKYVTLIHDDIYSLSFISKDISTTRFNWHLCCHTYYNFKYIWMFPREIFNTDHVYQIPFTLLPDWADLCQLIGGYGISINTAVLMRCMKTTAFMRTEYSFVVWNKHRDVHAMKEVIVCILKCMFS